MRGAISQLKNSNLHMPDKFFPIPSCDLSSGKRHPFVCYYC